MSKAKDLRDLTSEELEANCIEKRNELFQLTSEKKQSRQFEKPHRISLLKKEIARLLTVIGEKKQPANGI